MDEILIYTDGACRGNGKTENVGAWAYCEFFKGKRKEDAQAVYNTTNNQMELTAAIEALKSLKAAAAEYQIKVFSDSQYVVCGMTDWCHGWIAKNWVGVKNSDLWKELIQLRSKFPHIQFIYIKGHAADPTNIYVDKLCNDEMDKLLLTK